VERRDPYDGFAEKLRAAREAADARREAEKKKAEG
jgi:hypothetical protein